ncbi:MAG TPA: GAF domain-containing sensor histidine kinase [Chloroflexota bacterium]
MQQRQGPRGPSLDALIELVRREVATMRRHRGAVAALLGAVAASTAQVALVFRIRDLDRRVVGAAAGLGMAASVAAAYLGRELARQADRVDQERRRLAAVNAAALAIARPRSLEERLVAIAEQARAATRAAAAALGVGTDPDTPFHPWVYTGVDPEQAAAIGRIPRPVGVLGLIAREGHVVRIADVRRHPVFRGFPPHHPIIVSFLGVPIRHEGRSLGNLYLGNKADGQPFTREDEAVVELLAAHAALAIENARLVAEAERRLVALEEERRLREVFVSAVAHDLRNLMTPLLTTVQLLPRWEQLPVEHRERLLRSLSEQSRGLNRLVADLLDVSRIEAGRFVVERQATDLVAIARRIVEEQQALAERHRLVLEAPKRLEGEWDADRLAQALRNLVDNAVKYSPGGGTVSVRLRSLDDQVEVCVQDQGIGLRPEDIPLLFEPFRRLERMERHTLRGVGLGLFIVKGIVEAHGGRIWATSPGPGQGSTFCFALPRRPP